MYNQFVKFSDWITRQYINWRGDKIGREGSVSAFARWIGVKQPTMNRWLTGENIPESADAINKLSAKYGDEVYSALGLPPPTDIGPALDQMTDRELIEYVQRRLGPQWQIVEKRSTYNPRDKP